MIEFQKTLKQTKILNPLKNFEEDTLTFEYRADPLIVRKKWGHFFENRAYSLIGGFAEAPSVLKGEREHANC